MKKEHKPKPLILAVHDAERDIINSVNNALRANVPCYLLAMILETVQRQIKDGASKELSNATAQYNQVTTDENSSAKENNAK